MPTLVRAPLREVRTPVSDSRRWAGFAPRPDDIVVATFAKCGTTWTQRIVDLLVFQSPEVRPFGEISPWLDATIFHPLEDDLATLEAQTHRRFVKSHLPFDALPLWEEVKYIHVGRDGRDARLSWQNHQQGFAPAALQRIIASAAALAAERGETLSPPPPADVPPADYLRGWLDELEAALARPEALSDTFFGFEATWWRERRRANLLLVHYDDLQRDLAGEMRRISDFLEIDTPAALMPRLVEAARFSAMKRDGDALFPRLSEMFDRGADRFLNEGRSGRGRALLSDAENRRYDAIAGRAVTPGLVSWLANGRASADPRAAPD